MRPPTTILLITANRLLRADFTAGSQPTLAGLWQQPRPADGDVSLWAESALRLGPKPGRQVWVLISELWTQTLALAGRSLVGLSDEELQQALAFEAEALSGLSALDSTVGFHVLATANGERQFWLTQSANSVVRDLEELIHNAGSRFAGLCHPAGLPRQVAPALVRSRSRETSDGGDDSRSLTTSATDNPARVENTWQRLEFWPDAVVGVSRSAPGQCDIQVSNVDPRQDHWRGGLERWRARDGASMTGASCTLVAGALALPADVLGPEPLRLDDELVLAEWLLGWAGQLHDSPHEVPLIRPAPRPPSAAWRIGTAVAAAALVLAVCGGHYGLLKLQTSAAKASLRKLEEPAKQKSELQQQSVVLVKQRDELRKTTEQLDSDVRLCTATIKALRRRLPLLLDSLARQRPDDLLVQKIETKQGEVRVHGLCLEPQLAVHFARSLGETMSSVGWEVQAPNQNTADAKNRASGTLWSFELRVKEGAIDAAEQPEPAFLAIEH